MRTNQTRAIVCDARAVRVRCRLAVSNETAPASQQGGLALVRVRWRSEKSDLRARTVGAGPQISFLA